MELMAEAVMLTINEHPKTKGVQVGGLELVRMLISCGLRGTLPLRYPNLSGNKWRTMRNRNRFTFSRDGQSFFIAGTFSLVGR
jgi:hypothetical protein